MFSGLVGGSINSVFVPAVDIVLPFVPANAWKIAAFSFCLIGLLLSDRATLNENYDWHTNDVHWVFRILHCLSYNVL